MFLLKNLIRIKAIEAGFGCRQVGNLMRDYDGSYQDRTLLSI